MKKIIGWISIFASVSASVFILGAAPAKAAITITPTAGALNGTFSISGSDFNDTSDKLWFSNGTNSTFLRPYYVIEGNTMYFNVPPTLCPGAETESCSSNFSLGTPAGTYSIYMNRINTATNQTEKTTFGTFTVTGAVGVHSVGTNILASDGTVYRLLNETARNPYTSAGAFLSYKFNSWSTLVTANEADMALPISKYTSTETGQEVTAFIAPRNGSLINDNGTVYLITGGLRAGFANEASFKGLGYSYTNVYPGDTSFMVSLAPINSAAQKHPNGTLINDNGTLYVMQNGYRVGFPSMQILDSWGYWVSDAVPANSYDRASEISGIMTYRMINQMNL